MPDEYWRPGGRKAALSLAPSSPRPDEPQPAPPLTQRPAYCSPCPQSHHLSPGGPEAHFAYRGMNFLKDFGSTNRWNPGRLLRCGAESPRTTTNHGVIEAQK